MQFLNRAVASLLCVAAFSCQTVIAGAQIAYHVVADTSTLKSTTGFLDLQFNPGGADTLSATLSISDFVTDGALNGTATTTGSVTGSLPGPPNLTIVNVISLSSNDYFEGITFGNSISFDATFGGSALTPSSPFPASGSTFALSLYAADGATSLLSTDPSGAALLINLLYDGSTSTENFPSNAVGGTPIATATLLNAPSAVPEPQSALFLFSLALCVACFARRRHWQL